MNFVTVHGIGFNFTEPETFGPYIVSNLENLGPVYNCKFPLGDQIKYDIWESVLEKAISSGEVELNEKTIVIAHSLGTMFFPKFIAKHNIKVFGLIAIAGGFYPGYKGPTDDFMPTTDEMAYAKNNIKVKHFIYSNNDRYFLPEIQQNYLNAIDAEPHFIPGKGHFGRTEKITSIPEVISIANTLIDQISQNNK